MAPARSTFSSGDRMVANAKDRPLAGIRVLDLTQFLSGPYATQILADLGADIIKLEPPQGDPIRVVPPHFVGEDSVYYLCINRNKRCIAVDMKVDAGRELVKKLALSSDIVMENFRPGVLERLGLSVDALRREKPSLIWCSITGFGQDGPYRNKPAYYMHSGVVPGRQGRGHESIPTYRSFEAKDGIHIVITANTERMWQGLARAFGHEEWLVDSRFTTNSDRLKHKHTLWPMLEDAFRARAADEWIPILEAEEIPVGVVNTLDRVMKDPQIRHRDMVLDLESPDGRK